MWTEQMIREEYARLDRLLGVDTSHIPVSFSARMVRRYGACTFRGDTPTAIRLAAFLKEDDTALLETARHEYAHAAVALLTGKRHAHDDAWRAVCRRIDCPEERLAEPCAAAERNCARVVRQRGVYVVTCLRCGAESEYLRRGPVVQALERGRRGCRCRACGGTKFRLEKRFVPL